MGTLSFGAFSIHAFLAASKTYGSQYDMFIVWGTLFAISAVAHYFIIKRNKWAWIIGGILELNPVLWVTNYMYLKNRWGEMSSLRLTDTLSNVNKISFVSRVLIVGSIFWMLAALGFVFIFKPYGNYVSELEWWQVAKIIVLPIVVTVVGYFLYSKVIQQKD